MQLSDEAQAVAPADATTEAPASDVQASATDSAPTENEPAGEADAQAEDPAQEAESTGAESDKDAADGDSGDTEADEFDLALEDGSLLAESDLASVKEFAKAHSLTGEQAKAMLDWSESQAAQVKQSWDTQVEAWKDECKKDPTYGGERFDRSWTHARSALAKYAPDGFVDMLEATGYGNHPALFALLAAVGADLAEPESIARGGRTAPQDGPNLQRMFRKSYADMADAAARNTA